MNVSEIAAHLMSGDGVEIGSILDEHPLPDYQRVVDHLCQEYPTRLVDILRYGCASIRFGGQLVDMVLIHHFEQTVATLRTLPSEWWEAYGVSVAGLQPTTTRRLLKVAPDLIVLPGQGFLQELDPEDQQSEFDRYWLSEVQGRIESDKYTSAWQALLKAASGYTAPDFEQQYRMQHNGKQPRPEDYIDADRYWQASTDVLRELVTLFVAALEQESVELPDRGGDNWISRRLSNRHHYVYTERGDDAGRLAGYFDPKK